MHTDITLALPGEDSARLRRAFDRFVTVSTKLDKEFQPRSSTTSCARGCWSTMVRSPSVPFRGCTG